MKKLINKYLTIAVVGMTMLSVNACSWLDVTPQAQVDIDKMFAKPEGFQNALLGVYTSMTRTAQYGQDMTYGFMDVLAQYYTVYNIGSHDYYYVARMNYGNAQSLDRVKAMWLNSYNSIANCNVLLEQLEGKKADFFEGNEYRLIKGETYALRAYLHFDLFRMFAPVWEKAKGSMTIPYADSFSKKIHSQRSGEEVIRMVLTDLDSAANLLNGADPVQLDSYKSMSNHFDDLQTAGNVFASYRGFRMNYYAVKALMARVNFYKGDNNKAFQYAEEVIAAKENGFFKFTSQSEFEESEAKRNVLLLDELIFALDDATVNERWFGISKTDDKAFKVEAYKSIYDRSNDFRINLLSGDKVSSLKYAKLSGAKNAKLPMLRISEMYLIAAEAGYNIDKTLAIGRIGELKENRGCALNMAGYSFEELQEEVLAEARREFLGEGQLFYWYKRLQRDKIKRGDVNMDMPLENYILPLPATEVEFGDRVQPGV